MPFPVPRPCGAFGFWGYFCVRALLPGDFQGKTPGNDKTRRQRQRVLNGGADQDRTDDLYNAIVALSQLSYGPTLVRVADLLMLSLRRGAYLEGSPNVGKTLFQKFLAIVVV